MQKTSQLAKELLNHCQQVFKISQGKPLDVPAWESLAPDIKPLKYFLGISDFQVVIICYYIHISLTDNDITIDEIIKHLGNDLSILPEINDAIDQLLTKGYLLEKVTTGMQTEVLKTVVVHQRTLKALVNGKKKFLKMQPVTSILSFMEHIMSLVEFRSEREITGETLYQEANRMFAVNNHIAEVQWLKSFNMPIMDRLVFLMVCFEFCGWQ